MKRLLIFYIAIALFSCAKDGEPLPNDCLTENISTADKINGGSVLQTWLITDDGETIDLAQKTNANWVSLSPIIGIKDVAQQQPSYKYDFRVSDQIYKMKSIIPNISNSGLYNIMLKPLTSFWVVDGSTFRGDFFAETEQEWQEVERAYTELIYGFAKLSEEFPEVKLLSIGTELKEFTKRRPGFFRALISKIRTDFPYLKLTYAANWDEYPSVSFWDDLDYIGVNPYFPLLNKKDPSFNEIKNALIPIKNNLSNLSCQYSKPILFTEYGFRSADYGLWESWLKEFYYDKAVNFEIQNNAYTAFYDAFWDEPWVAGGFFWEWYIPYNGEIDTPNSNGWYVNDKPVEQIIKAQYAK